MAVAAIDHPYIRKIFEIGEHGQALFLVMEYVAGETLDDKRRARTVRFGTAITAALSVPCSQYEYAFTAFYSFVTAV